jgi:predicted negative regulator of RcsB-dependent stress response
MAALDLQEQEQLAEFKAWWARYGNLLLTSLIIIFLTIAVYNGWRYYQRSQALAAAAVFDQLQNAAASNDKAKTREISGVLLANYGSTSFAPMGALITAKVQFEGGDIPTAKAQLQWVIDNSRDEDLKHVAHVRLAGVLLDEKKFDEGLKLLETTHPAHFDAIYADRRGDLLLAQGKSTEARTAWQEALAKLDNKTTLRGSVQLKLDLTGGGAPITALASPAPAAAVPAVSPDAAATVPAK